MLFQPLCILVNALFTESYLIYRNKTTETIIGYFPDFNGEKGNYDKVLNSVLEANKVAFTQQVGYNYSGYSMYSIEDRNIATKTTLDIILSDVYFKNQSTLLLLFIVF